MIRFTIIKCDTNEVSSIVDAIDRLSQKLGTLSALKDAISFKDFITAVFVAFVGALSAYCFNHLHWKTVKKNSNITNLSKELGALVKQLEDEAVHYWVKDYDEKLSCELFVAEVTIKSKIRVINRIIDMFIPKLDEDEFEYQIMQLKSFKNELFDLVTGDDFESKRRKAAKIKAIRISNCCSNIRATIAQLDLSL